MAGPPWAGPASMAALATFGQVEWLVTLGFLVAVPVAWLLALRTLRGEGVDGPAAVVAALGYALAPVLVGALGGGWAGALVWAVVLPLLVHALGNWIRSGTLAGGRRHRIVAGAGGRRAAAVLAARAAGDGVRPCRPQPPRRRTAGTGGGFRPGRPGSGRGCVVGVARTLPDREFADAGSADGA